MSEHGPIAIIDAAGGNIASVMHAIRSLGAEPNLVRHPDRLADYDRAILPGVGALPSVMDRLRDNRMDQAITKHAEQGKPLLGICVGMQALATSGDEAGGTEGLGLIPGRVTKMPTSAHARLPHVGWNTVTPTTHNALPGLTGEDDFYFVHSYAFVVDDPTHSAAFAEHAGAFTAAVRRDNILGVQFHPEKSQHAGLALLDAFLRLN